MIILLLINLHYLPSDLTFFLERIRINKYDKLICSLYVKNRYVVHMRTLKQALNHGLILRKVYRVIKFNEEAWLKEYSEINTEL